MEPIENNEEKPVQETEQVETPKPVVPIEVTVENDPTQPKKPKFNMTECRRKNLVKANAARKAKQDHEKKLREYTDLTISRINELYTTELEKIKSGNIEIMPKTEVSNPPAQAEPPAEFRVEERVQAEEKPAKSSKKSKKKPPPVESSSSESSSSEEETETEIDSEEEEKRRKRAKKQKKKVKAVKASRKVKPARAVSKNRYKEEAYDSASDSEDVDVEEDDYVQARRPVNRNRGRRPHDDYTYTQPRQPMYSHSRASRLF